MAEPPIKQPPIRRSARGGLEVGPGKDTKHAVSGKCDQRDLTIGEFLKAGATAGAAGSALVDGKALKEKNWAAITARAQEFVKAVAAAGVK